MSIHLVEKEIDVFKQEFRKKIKNLKIDNTNVFVYSDEMMSQNKFFSNFIEAEEFIYKYVDILTQKQLNDILYDYNVKITNHQKQIIVGMLKKSIGLNEIN